MLDGCRATESTLSLVVPGGPRVASAPISTDIGGSMVERVGPDAGRKFQREKRSSRLSGDLSVQFSRQYSPGVDGSRTASAGSHFPHFSGAKYVPHSEVAIGRNAQQVKEL